jgi:hypothetical protein
MNAKGRARNFACFENSMSAALICILLLATSNESLALDKLNPTLNGLYSSQGIDIDRDGLYDSIIVNVGLNVPVSAIYKLQGELVEVAGNETFFAANNSDISFGSKSVNLTFYAVRHPGVYRLMNLRLSDNNGLLLDHAEEPYSTANFSYMDPDPKIARFTGSFKNYAEDVDDDGKFEFLTLDAGIHVFFPGRYTLTGYLYDLNGSEVAWSIDSRDFNPGNQTMHLKFDGKLIGKHGVNGPYRLEKFILAGQDWAIMDTKRFVDYTLEYRSSDFREPAMPTNEKMISGTGEGELVLTTIIDHKVPVLAGMYNLDILGINIPPISTPMKIVSSKYGYNYNFTNVSMPNKPNDFIVYAKGVKDLNIGIRKDAIKNGSNFTRVWVTSKIIADRGIAGTKSDILSPGRYQVRLFGEAVENVSQVDLIMTMVKKIIVNGRFNLAINTTGFPSGEYSISAKAENGSFSLDELALDGLAIED